MGKRFKMVIDDDMTGEDFVAEVAEMACSSDLERAGGVSPLTPSFDVYSLQLKGFKAEVLRVIHTVKTLVVRGP